MKKNPYIVLGLDRNACDDDIKQAYRRAAKHSHPDLCLEKDGQRFKEVQDAYDILKDRDRRRACDEKLDRAEYAAPRQRQRGGLGSTLGPFSAAMGKADPLDAPAWHRRPASGIYLEIRLTPAEARNGGIFPIRLPLARQCPDCRAAFPWIRRCGSCGGSGRIRQEETFSLHIPSGITDGTRITLRLQEDEAFENALHLLFRIDPWAQ